jgi:hypothetical protein
LFICAAGTVTDATPLMKNTTFAPSNVTATNDQVPGVSEMSLT